MLCQFPSLEAISVQCVLHNLPELVNYVVLAEGYLPYCAGVWMPLPT